MQRERCDTQESWICPDRRASATLPFSLKANLAAPIGLLALLLLVFPAQAGASGSGNETRLSVWVDCHCSDPAGETFCSAFKDKVRDSPAYRLVDHADEYGIGVHLWCVDLFAGLPAIQTKLSGTMSAVSVAFTIYSDKLPGEVYEDSSVFRVGKGAADEMAQSVLSAVGQLAAANKAVFERMRATPKPAPAPTQRVIE